MACIGAVTLSAFPSDQKSIGLDNNFLKLHNFGVMLFQQYKRAATCLFHDFSIMALCNFCFAKRVIVFFLSSFSIMIFQEQV